MARAWNGIWLTLAFLCELAALAALAVWGWSVPGPTVLRLLLAVGAPVGAAVLWGLFAAPRAPIGAPVLAVTVKVAVFGAGAVALVATGHPRMAVALVIAALFSSVLSTPPAPLGPLPG